MSNSRRKCFAKDQTFSEPAPSRYRLPEAPLSASGGEVEVWELARKARLNRVFENDGITTLIAALGAGVGANL